MAQGGDHNKDFGKIQLPVPMKQCTKQEAIHFLRVIIETEKEDEKGVKNCKQLLTSLDEKYKNPHDVLDATDMETFVRTAGPKCFPFFLEAATASIHQRQVMRVLDGANELVLMDEKLRTTKDRLQDALDRLNIVQQELRQVSNQQIQERTNWENDRAALRNQMNLERQQFEREINQLKDTIDKLTEDKRDMRRQIEVVREELKKEKELNDKFKHDQDLKLEQLSLNNMGEIGKLGKDVEELKKENSKLKTREPYKLVAYCVTLMTNALYKYVHQTKKLSKNYYSIQDLQDQLDHEYIGKEDGKRAAEERWGDIKRMVHWTERAKSVLNQLAVNRERGPDTYNVHVEYGDFSEAVRKMFAEKEIDEIEKELILELYANCNYHLVLRPN